MSTDADMYRKCSEDKLSQHLLLGFPISSLPNFCKILQSQDIQVVYDKNLLDRDSESIKSRSKSGAMRKSRSTAPV